MENSSSEASKLSPEIPNMGFREFLEECPPGRLVKSQALLCWRDNRGWVVNAPDILLHCDSAECSGNRFFSSRDIQALREKGPTNFYLSYICKNCNSKQKTFALSGDILHSDDREGAGHLYKYGEIPQFGPPTPAKLMSLIGAERDYFLKGRRCENQGLGIAAFAYYRRVVEKQKNRILAQISRVAVQVGADKEIVDELDSAQKEGQFTKSIESIKHALPQVLLISGHNPLTLLHSALSEGLHATSDDECLELATSIRVVLTELVDRINIALKEEKELTGAVSRLLQAKQKTKQ